jgi:hypothetical protein
MVFPAEKIFSFAKAMVSGIESMVGVTHTIITTTGTKVTAAKAIVSVAPTIIWMMNERVAHRTFDLRTELRQFPAGFLRSSSPLASLLIQETHHQLRWPGRVVNPASYYLYTLVAVEA